MTKRPLSRSPNRTNLSSPFSTEAAGLIEAFRFPGAAVPDDDVAAAVLADGDDAFEVEVLDGMVLGPCGHAFFQRSHGRATWHRPAHEHASDLESEVVVQSDAR